MEKLFAQLSDEARGQLLREGLRVKDQAARLKSLEEAIEYGRGLIVKYDAETLGELPQEEQLEFARLWANATGGGQNWIRTERSTIEDWKWFWSLLPSQPKFRSFRWSL